MDNERGGNFPASVIQLAKELDVSLASVEQLEEAEQLLREAKEEQLFKQGLLMHQVVCLTDGRRVRLEGKSRGYFTVRPLTSPGEPRAAQILIESTEVDRILGEESAI